MTTIYWRYQSNEARAAGALPPESARFDYGERSPGQGRGATYAERWRAIESGARRAPSDCPPMRAMSHTGFVVRTPVRTILTGRDYDAQRSFSESMSSGGAIEVSGAPWPNSDSGYVASWIGGTEYLKLVSGIQLVCPKDLAVMQGPVPNSDLVEDAVALDGYTAIERSTRKALLADGRNFIVELNFIYRAPPPRTRIVIEAGDVIGWFLPFALAPGPVRVVAADCAPDAI